MSGVTLVVMAAGMGSRFGGVKQLEPVGPSGELVMDYSVFDAIRAGISKVVFVVRRDLEADFRAAVGSRYEGRIEVRYAFQELDLIPPGFGLPPGRTKPWGTGHAVLAAKDAVTGPFVAINADDFYGAESFSLLAAHLARTSAPGSHVTSPDRYAMVAFRLANTLSEHGSVSRGVCETDASGRLVAITEHTRICRTPGGVRNDEPARPRDFDGSEPVSMNFWGFTPSFLPRLTGLFERFLRERGADPAAEFFLPAAVDALIRRREAVVTVLTTLSPWLGVTYREDLPLVRAKVRALVTSGSYPERLWG